MPRVTPTIRVVETTNDSTNTALTFTGTNAGGNTIFVRRDLAPMVMDRWFEAHDREAARALAPANYPFRVRPRGMALLVGYPEHKWYVRVEAWARGGTTGRLYAIGENVWQVDGLGRVVRRTCWDTVWPTRGQVTRADRVWAMRLAIEFDEPRVLRDLPWAASE